MNTKRILCIILAALNLVCVNVLLVYAAPGEGEINDVPTETQAVTTEPVEITQTEPASQPTTTGGDIDPSASASSSGIDGTEPTSVSSTEQTGPTESTVEPSTPRPTEYPENPSVSFEIQTPVLVKPDDDKDNSAKEWENIDEDEIIKENDKLSVEGGSGGGFGFDKNTVSVKDERNPIFFVLFIVFECIAVGLLTLAILLPVKKTVAIPAEAEDEEEISDYGDEERY